MDTGISMTMGAKRILALVIGLAGLAAGARGEVMQAGNSRVTLDLPPGFVRATGFAGFQNEALGASIVIMDMPEVAFDQIKTGLTAEGLATKGITNVKPGVLTREGEHIYLTGEQATAAGIVAKAMLVIREGGMSALVTANVPRASVESGAISEAGIAAIMASARVVETAALVKPPFTLSELGPFKPAGVVAGAAWGYTLDGILTPDKKQPGRALFLVAPSVDNRPVGDVRALAKRSLEQTAGAQEVKASGSKEVVIGGLRGVASTATALTKDNPGAPLAIYHVVLARPEGGYVVIVGRTSQVGGVAETMAQFERMAASFKWE